MVDCGHFLDVSVTGCIYMYLDFNSEIKALNIHVNQSRLLLYMYVECNIMKYNLQVMCTVTVYACIFVNVHECFSSKSKYVITKNSCMEIYVKHYDSIEIEIETQRWVYKCRLLFKVRLNEESLSEV